MLPEFLTGPQWVAVFEEYGYCPDVSGHEIDDTYLINIGKSLNGPPGGFWFSASAFAELEVQMVVDYMCDVNFFDEEELWDAIDAAARRGGWSMSNPGDADR